MALFEHGPIRGEESDAELFHQVIGMTYWKCALRELTITVFSAEYKVHLK